MLECTLLLSIQAVYLSPGLVLKGGGNVFILSTLIKRGTHISYSMYFCMVLIEQCALAATVPQYEFTTHTHTHKKCTELPMCFSSNNSKITRNNQAL